MKSFLIRNQHQHTCLQTPCILLIILSCFSISSICYADIYKYIDPQGRTYFTDRKKDSSYRLISRIHIANDRIQHKPIGFDIKKFRANKREFTPIIDRIAARYQLDRDLVHAVVYVESSYDPKAKSSSGCIGLMQLKPSTARRYGVDNAWPPVDNIRAGTLYLRYLIKLFDGDLKLALAGYNAGENAVLRNNRKIPNYPETQRYVKKVMKHYQTRSKKKSNYSAIP